MENESIDDMQKKRLEYLNKIYSITNANPYLHASGAQIAGNLGYNENESRAVIDYLQKENLIEVIPFTENVSITHNGIKEVEQALKNPKKPTEHFSPINIISVEKMINSQIQQNTNESVQSQEIKKEIKVGNIREDKKKGLIAGGVSIFISIIFAIMVFKFGWDITGQIFTAISALFGILGIGSFIKPDTIGIKVSELLENMSRGQED